MTDEQVGLVQQSFARISTDSISVAQVLFQHLFKTNPELQPLFKGDMDEQYIKLMQMIRIAVNGLNNIEALVPALQALGLKHAAYGITKNHYETMGGALIWSLEQCLGDDFDADTRRAWAVTYSKLVSVMTAHEKD